MIPQPAHTRKPRPTSYFSKPLLPAILLLCSIALTVVGWHISRNHLDEKTQARFEYKTNVIHAAIQARMSAYEQVLRSAVGLFYATDTVTRSEWRDFVLTLRLEQSYPGIQGLGYAMRLAAGDVKGFTDNIRKEGFTDFSVWPAEPRAEYFSIVYLEPFTPRNRRAFGYDMYTEQKRRETMTRARTTGLPALSPMVTLVQETQKNVQKGCLLYLPVYDRKKTVDTEAARSAALKGFVYSPFRINDLMQGILGGGEAEIEFEVYDGRNTDTALLFYTSHGYNQQKTKADYVFTRIMPVAGHEWTLVFTARKSFLSAYEAGQPNVIAVAGILVNLLLLLILLQLHSLSKRNQTLAERYKAEKDRYEIVSESTNDIIWEWDVVTNTVSFNKNFQTAIGIQLPAPELSFDAWISHLHAADKERVVNTIKTLIGSGQNFWTDEYRLQKTNGSITYILNRGRIIRDAAGAPVRMVGSMINITERKHAEDTQRRFNEELEQTVQVRTRELQRSNDDLARFAHITSHDLKEPARKMLIFIDQIRIRYAAALGDGVELLNKLNKSATRLHQMIESILTFSIVSYEPHPADTVDLNMIVRNVAEDLELIIEGQQAQLNVAPLPTVEGSDVLLHQLFYNLINNALKFSKPGTTPIINIEAQELQAGKDALVAIKIADNGIGFHQHQADHIFQSFVRLHSKDRYEGTGLGLALCKRIVERHGGTIEAFGAPGEGAAFTIRLPRKQPGSIVE